MNKKAIAMIVSLLAVLTIVLAYVVINRPASQVTLYVDPQTPSQYVGQDFTIKINISDVAYLYGWELKLRWNTTVLNVVNATEGPFLKSGGNTFFIPTINNTAGYIKLDCTLLGNISGVSGRGTLGTIQFHVKANGNCNLDFYDTILLDSSEQAIPHVVRDGHFSTTTQ